VLLTFHHLHPDSIEEGLRRNRGIVATAMHCVNSVPYVCAADPGIRTYLDLPLIAGRAALHCARADRTERVQHDPGRIETRDGTDDSFR